MSRLNDFLHSFDKSRVLEMEKRIKEALTEADQIANDDSEKLNVALYFLGKADAYRLLLGMLSDTKIWKDS